MQTNTPTLQNDHYIKAGNKHFSPRILIFIGSLRAGGKERRVIELLTYLKAKTAFTFLVVMTKDKIDYQDFYKLDIPYFVLQKKRRRYDPTIPFQLYNLCRLYQPQLIHTWGRMQSFYTLPVVIGQHIPLVNSQITGAPVRLASWSVNRLLDKLNFHFSTIVLANSRAGMEAFEPPVRKRTVIYNGINLRRFMNLPDASYVRSKYKIETPFAVVMSASFTATKDYDLFFTVAEYVTRLQNDVTFIGVGGYDGDDKLYKRMIQLSAGSSRILFPGKIDDVEALVNASTIGVLFSVNGEGISNSIMEYMALGKPVIANAAGGTTELVRHGENGYLIRQESPSEIAALICSLINDPAKRQAFGKRSKEIIEMNFSLERMGAAFERVYDNVLQNKVS